MPGCVEHYHRGWLDNLRLASGYPWSKVRAGPDGPWLDVILPPDGQITLTMSLRMRARGVAMRTPWFDPTVPDA